MNTEEHPLEPFLPKGAKLLILGSFPPPKNKWSMNFFYPNFINDMWRIFGLSFFDDKKYFLSENNKTFEKEKIISFLEEKGIALYDAVKVARRLNGNASDKFLEAIEPVDLMSILKKIPDCTDIAVAGQKSLETLVSEFNAPEPKTGRFEVFNFCERKTRLWRMPSSSRAYPCPLEAKAELYAEMFRRCSIL